MKRHLLDEAGVGPLGGRIGAMVAVILTASCGRTLPPPAAPEHVAPTNFISVPPLSGMGQVVLDSPDGPANVVEVLSRSTASAYAPNGATAFASAETTRAVCTTPCEVNLPYGSHELRFTLLTDVFRESTANIVAGERPTVARHAVGRREETSTAYFFAMTGLGVGGLAVLYGAPFSLVPSLYPTDGNGNPTSSPSSLALAGLIGGAALAVVSIVVMLISQPESQNGSTSQWVLSPSL